MEPVAEDLIIFNLNRMSAALYATMECLHKLILKHFPNFIFVFFNDKTYVDFDLSNIVLAKRSTKYCSIGANIINVDLKSYQHLCISVHIYKTYIVLSVYLSRYLLIESVSFNLLLLSLPTNLVKMKKLYFMFIFSQLIIKHAKFKNNLILN